MERNSSNRISPIYQAEKRSTGGSSAIAVSEHCQSLRMSIAVKVPTLFPTPEEKMGEERAMDKVGALEANG